MSGDKRPTVYVAGTCGTKEADRALFDALDQTVRRTERRRLLRLPCNINDPAFAAALVAALRDAMATAEA